MISDDHGMFLCFFSIFLQRNPFWMPRKMTNRNAATTIVVKCDNICLPELLLAKTKFKTTIANRNVNSPFAHFLIICIFSTVLHINAYLFLCQIKLDSRKTPLHCE